MKKCIVCKIKPALKGGKKKDGTTNYQSYCWRCREAKAQPHAKWIKQNLRNQKLKGDHCEQCGFIPEDPCQLDLDHIIQLSEGGEHTVINTQTLCANCHRLKTKNERNVNKK